MKTYYMTIAETRVTTVEVHAETEREAREKVNDALDEGLIDFDTDEVEEALTREIIDETDNIQDNYIDGGMPKLYEIQ